jgi:hypothetical protein
MLPQSCDGWAAGVISKIEITAIEGEPLAAVFWKIIRYKLNPLSF